MPQLLEQIAHACPLFKCKELLPLWTPSPFSTSSGSGVKHHSSTLTLLADHIIHSTTYRFDYEQQHRTH